MSKTQLLFLIILIEGYVVLAVELLAIRQLIPFVGSGTEIIAIIISAVLLPLACGYYSGGRAFQKHFSKIHSRGGRVMSIRGILVRNIITTLIILSFGLSYPFLEIFFTLLGLLGIFSRLAQTALYSALFLIWPIYLLGQTVPLVSNYFSQRRLSEITGRMLFFSTTGAFLGSVFSTIILMSFIGVHLTVIFTLSLLVVLVILMQRRLFSFEVATALMLLALTILFNNGRLLERLGVVSNNAYNMVAVKEITPEDNTRLMLINRGHSSKVSDDPQKLFEYANYIESHFFNHLPHTGTPKNILILGAGGFTLGLNDRHNNYTYVDIDKDLKTVSEKYFLKRELGKNKKFTVTSARAFVHNDTSLYDLIIIDVFTNWITVPMETVTREFLLDVKKRLQKGGVIVVNMVAGAGFNDRFTTRYNNTFASVFPAYSRQVLEITATPTINEINIYGQPNLITNILYIYRDTEFADDRTIYTDDLNTYSLDR